MPAPPRCAPCCSAAAGVPMYGPAATLPAPRGFGHTFTLTEPPHFFNARDGVLPVLFGVKLRRFGGGWQWVAFP